MSDKSYDLSKSIPEIKFNLLDTLDKIKKQKLKIINKITCIAGCNYCCCQLVVVTVAEALLIYDYLRTQKKWDEVKEKCKQQIKLLKNASIMSWFMMNQKCPMLINGYCGVYEVRPVSCAVYFMTSNPEACNPHSSIPQIMQPLRFSDLQKNFNEKLETNFPNDGIMKFRLPLQNAILLAECISIQSGLSLDQAIKLFFNELK